MIAQIVLAALMRECAPSVGPITMGALVIHESGGRPYAIDDDTTRRSFDPRTLTSAVTLAEQLLAAGHTIDVGYSQIDSNNFAAYSLDVRNAFDPCLNLRTASSILSADYLRAERAYGPGQTALAHALSAYNSGDERSGSAYAAAVFATAVRLAGRQ